MKKLIYMGAMALIASGGIFWSCQKDELTFPEQEMMLKKGQLAAALFVSEVVYNSPACVGTEHSLTIQGWNGTKNIGVQLYDDIEDTWSPIEGLPNGQLASPQTFYLTFPLEQTYKLRYSVSGNKNDGGTNGQVEFLVEVDDCKVCDDADFSYKTDDNLDIVFSYNHSEEAELTIQFTFPQVMDLDLNEDGKYVAPDGKLYILNNPTNQTVFTWTGFVDCNSDDPTTFEFAHAADCGPSTAKDGKATIWTDAKIVAVNGLALVDDQLTLDINEGPFSLKGGLENIIYSGCPIKTK